MFYLENHIKKHKFAELAKELNKQSGGMMMLFEGDKLYPNTVSRKIDDLMKRLKNDNNLHQIMEEQELIPSQFRQMPDNNHIFVYGLDEDDSNPVISVNNNGIYEVDEFVNYKSLNNKSKKTKKTSLLGYIALGIIAFSCFKK